jgi:putative ATPase
VLNESPVQPVPAHLRDKSGQANKRMEQGKGYAYSHGFPEAISGQDFLDRPVRLYSPKPIGAESAIAQRLERWRGLKAALSARPGKVLAEGGHPP